MKKILAITLFCLFVMTAFAQKASLNIAYNLYYEKDFVKAKEAIDLCVLDEKLGIKPSTWLYKGNIYFYLASNEYNEAQKGNGYVKQFPDAAIDAYDAFQKALSMNKNVEAYEMLSPNEGIANLYILLFVRGVDCLIDNDFQKAKSTLEKAITGYELKTPQHPLQGELYYYYAYALEMLKENDNARRYYEKAILDGSTNANVYLRLIEGYKSENNREKVKELVEKGKKVMPDDPNILVAEADYHYWIEDDAKGDELLKNLPASVYDNPEASVNIANFQIKKKNYEEAEKLLKKAARIYPDNYTICYNLGVCCYYLSEARFKSANELEAAGKKAEAFSDKTASENYLNEAERFFNVALKQAPEDLNILQTLRAIYARMQSPKYDEVDRKIQSIEKK